MEERNVNALTENKEIFIGFVKKFYSRPGAFPNSSDYFHKKVIGIIRASDPHKDLFKDKLFLEFVYATLSSWGLDRMDGSARLVEFEVFRKSVLNNSPALETLLNYRMHDLNEIGKTKVKDALSVLFDNLNVMVRKARLVGVSKALHHLLPDLVPPIDRKYTLDFFYGNTAYGEKDQKEKFLAIFDKFCLISDKLGLNNEDLKERWDTSVPKLIDNAIIGFVSDTKKQKGKPKKLK